MNPEEFSKLDWVKAGSPTFNTKYKRASMQLTSKPYVELTGIGGPIRAFDGSNKSSYSISFSVADGNCFDIYGSTMIALADTLVIKEEDKIRSIFNNHDSPLEGKEFVKSDQDKCTMSFYVHPTFTKYVLYDRKSNRRTETTLNDIKKKSTGLYSLIAKVSHLDVSFDKEHNKISYGMIAYVDSLCYIIPKKNEIGLLKAAEEKLRVERPEFSFGSLDNLTGELSAFLGEKAEDVIVSVSDENGTKKAKKRKQE